ncbi:hypothetical protein RRG08_013390 [Elysia crispata]|uniref:Uncharacterized protein n=1 Tax=Elysia crispata TaxID=231223 RepID=A0AAE1EAL5_9GAST|nr:hypothetical protein RRG08_013390 [Elysia crispata]
MSRDIRKDNLFYQNPFSCYGEQTRRYFSAATLSFSSKKDRLLTILSCDSDQFMVQLAHLRGIYWDKEAPTQMGTDGGKRPGKLAASPLPTPDCDQRPGKFATPPDCDQRPGKLATPSPTPDCDQTPEKLANAPTPKIVTKTWEACYPPAPARL